MDDGHARVKMDEVARQIDRTWFAWIGGSDSSGVYYYRIHSPVILIEFDHQRPANLARFATDPNCRRASTFTAWCELQTATIMGRTCSASTTNRMRTRSLRPFCYDVRGARNQDPRLFCDALRGAGRRFRRAPASVAEWVIREGGRVMVNGQRQVIDDLAKLPAAPFRLTTVDLIGTIIDPKDLSRLSSLGSLCRAISSRPNLTPFSDAPLDANDSLKQLAGLSNLERLFFSLHFLPTYNVDDRGVGYLAPLTSLRELRLSQSRVKTPNLAPFRRLESLDLSDCPEFGDHGMVTLERLKNYGASICATLPSPTKD